MDIEGDAEGAGEEDLDTEDTGWLEPALRTLVAAYIVSLVKACLAVRIPASLKAADDLNKALTSAGYPKKDVKLSALTLAGIEATQKYEKTLTKQFGTYVVMQIVNTEKLRFAPWLKDLKENTRKDVLNIMQAAKTEGWDSKRLRDELDKTYELNVNKRVKAAAFTETRTQEYMSQIDTWKSYGLQYVQRHSVGDSHVCRICIGMDEEVYEIGTEAPLSHTHCRCFYTPVVNKGDET